MNRRTHKEIKRAVTRALHGRSNVLIGAALLGMSMTAAAAEEAGGDVDEIIVSGIRASIESAIAVKKNESSIVEAISAEDIG